MRFFTLVLALVSLLSIDARVALAQSPSPDPDSSLTDSRGFGDILRNYSIRLGVEASGPLRFQDVPDQMIETTSAFQYGGSLAFLFGNELKDIHRLGLGLGYQFVAESNTRSLKFLDAYLLYETGHPLILQVGVGTNLAMGTDGYAEQYRGIYNSLALRYSNLKPSKWSSIAVSPGLALKSYVVPGNMALTSFFAGVQLTVAYNTNK